MGPTEVLIRDAEGMESALDALAGRIAEGRRPGVPLRLVGVRVEGLVARERVQRQLVLGERDHGWSEADRAVDRATRRFGAGVVRPASLLS